MDLVDWSTKTDEDLAVRLDKVDAPKRLMPAWTCWLEDHIFLLAFANTHTHTHTELSLPQGKRFIIFCLLTQVKQPFSLWSHRTQAPKQVYKVGVSKFNDDIRYLLYTDFWYQKCLNWMHIQRLFVFEQHWMCLYGRLGEVAYLIYAPERWAHGESELAWGSHLQKMQ